MTVILYIAGFIFFLLISNSLIRFLQSQDGIFTILFYIVALGGLAGYIFTDYTFLKYIYYFISFPALSLLVLKWLFGLVLVLVGYGNKK